VRQSRRRYLEAPGLPLHRRQKLVPGSTAAVVTAVDGSTDAAMVAVAGGLTDTVAAVVAGSIAGPMAVGVLGSIAGE
jgi:hypothetical protein